jgi:hypothetical protein
MDDETDGRDVHWMSYAELGQLRGTSAATARRMANRKRWRKQAGNDGTVRVAVPVNVSPARETPRETERETSRDMLPQAMVALETAIATLTDQLAKADARAMAATARADAAEAEHQRIAGEMAQAVEQRTAAQVEARVLREAENARQQLGRWRRAWRGWRGR